MAVSDIPLEKDGPQRDEVRVPCRLASGIVAWSARLACPQPYFGNAEERDHASQAARTTFLIWGGGPAAPRPEINERDRGRNGLPS